MEELLNKNWLYLIESLIYKVEKDRDYYKVKTRENSEMIRSMEKNYKILRRVYDSIYNTIAENFQLYIDSLEVSEKDKLMLILFTVDYHLLTTLILHRNYLTYSIFFTLLMGDFQLQRHIHLFQDLTYHLKLTVKKLTLKN